MVSDFLEENYLSWYNLVTVCTNEAPAMVGSRSGFTALVKQKNSRLRKARCLCSDVSNFNYKPQTKSRQQHLTLYMDR